MFYKKCVFRSLAKFTGKHLFQRLFFNKVAGLPATVFKMSLWDKCFSCEFCEISMNTFFTEHLRTTASDWNHDWQKTWADITIFSYLTINRSLIYNLIANFEDKVELLFSSSGVGPISISHLIIHSYIFSRKMNLKVVSATFLLVCFICLKESTYKTRKNVSYFTSKALFVLEIIKF